MEDCSQFKPDEGYNGNRGPTDKQPFETPFEVSLRQSIESRVGKATSSQSNLNVDMPDRPLVKQK